MKKLLVALGLVALAAFGVVGYLHSRYRAFLDAPVTPQGGEAVVQVKPGTGLETLGRQLQRAGVIRDTRVPIGGSVFYLWAQRVRHAGSRIKAGEYLFSGPETPGEVLDKIIRGEVRTYKVTIPEGLRLEEIMPLFEKAGLARATDLLRLAHDPAFVHHLGLHADSLEGFVFPDTYTLAKGLSAKEILTITVHRFLAAWKQAQKVRAPEVKLTRLQAVTLASIIEKETAQPAERPHISCVFHNRLDKHMRLQTDPTVIYSLVREGRWDGNLTRADLELKSPYNTYVIKGLPPGPIASPGEAALEAALHPSKCDDLFFVSRNDGTHVFCPTLACHERAVEKWQVEYFRHHRHPGRGG